MEPRQVMASQYVASESQHYRVGEHPGQSPGQTAFLLDLSHSHSHSPPALSRTGSRLFLRPLLVLHFPLTLLLTAMNIRSGPSTGTYMFASSRRSNSIRSVRTCAKWRELFSLFLKAINSGIFSNAPYL